MVLILENGKISRNKPAVSEGKGSRVQTQQKSQTIRKKK